MTFKEIVPGLLSSMISESEAVRQWAQWHLDELDKGRGTASRLTSLYVVIARSVITELSNADDPPPPTRRKRLWRAARYILRALPKARKAFLPLIINRLGDPGDHFESVLGCYQICLEGLGSDIWKEAICSAAEFPNVLLGSILDNPRLIDLLEADTRRLGEESLSDGPIAFLLAHTTSLAETGQEEMFLHAIKSIANFLLEKMQQGHLGLRLRCRCLALGIHVLAGALHDGTKRGSESCVASTFAAATMYADTLAGIALHGTFPHSKERVLTKSPLCVAGRALLRQILITDARITSSALFRLTLHVQFHQVKFRKAFKDVKGQATVTNPATSEEVVKAAAEEKLPTPQACKAIWQACYKALASESGHQALDVVLAPLSMLANLLPPAPKSYMVVRSDARQIPQLQKYLVSLRASIACIQTALSDSCKAFPAALEDFFLGLSEDTISEMCVKHAEHLMVLIFSPTTEIHIAAQNMIKSAFYDATVRADCFRLLLTINPAASLHGINSSLDSFLDTANRTIEASTLAAWTVKSLSDLLDVLCSMRDGLLRPGTNSSLLSSPSSAKAVADQIPRIWRLVNKSLALIFERTPKWATVIDSADLTAWFRDVTILSIEVVENLKVVEDAVATAQSADKETAAEIHDTLTLAVAIPLEKSLSWLRMNDAEMLYDTRNFVFKALACFGRDVPLPSGIKERFLHFADSQIAIKDEQERQTLLSIPELAELKHQIDPSLAPIDITSDSSDAGSDEEIVGYLASTGPKMMVDKEPKASSSSEPKKLVQRTLDFSNARPRKPSPPTAPAPTAFNKFRAAALEQSTSHDRSLSKLGALRLDHRQLAGKPAGKRVESRRAPAPASTGPAWEVPEKKMNVTSKVPTAASAVQGQQGKVVESDDTDTDSSSDDEAEAKGLAALKAKSPLKKIKAPKRAEAKTKFIPDDDRLLATMREQEEMERRRRLRAPADLTALHYSILSWPFNASGDLPPQEQEAREVSKQFADQQDYLSTFGPLLLMECWAQLQNAKEEYREDRSHNVEIASRANIDNFVDVHVVFVDKGAREVNDVDVVFLREANVPKANAKCALAKVQAFRRNFAGNQATLRLCLQNDKQGLNSALTSRTRWVVGQLFSLATIHRECAALLTAPYLDLRTQIFNGNVAPKFNVDRAEAAEVMRTYSLNEPQAHAVVGSLQRNGISLIQGPPGTGKTKTICGLVGRFLFERSKRGDSTAIVDPRFSVASGPKAKILVCAPSNAAIDEVAKRLKEALPAADGKLVRPKIIRIGRDEAMNVEVKDISLDFLLDQAVAGSSSNVNDTAVLQEEIRQLGMQRHEKQLALEGARKANNTPLVNELQSDMRLLMSKRTTAMSRLDEIKDKAKSDGRQRDAERRRIRQQILMEADVICCTLSGAGHESLSSLSIDFETVIIDEAAQAVELSTLIPLRYGCRKCIMVGDPNQLAPTVLSRPAESKGYSQSLFVRLFKPELVYLLR